MALSARLTVTLAFIVLLFGLYHVQYGHSPEMWAVVISGWLGWMATSPR
jgi:hypothetical protein